YSQFEITFAIAMLYFTWVQAEPIVLETGVGGLLDCTNIVKNVKACVFTSIGFDHMTVLGDTVEKIAAQKAGIAKPGASLICSPDCGEVLFRLLNDYADRTGKTHFPIVPDTAHETAFRELECDAAHTMFYYLGDVYRTGMGGRYQISNALTAIEAAKALWSEYSVTTEAIQRGLAETYVPGRMQILSEKPLILLDGAHNRDGILRLAEMLREKAVSPAVGIIGMTHADAADYAAQTLGACFDSVLCVDGFTPNAMPAETLCCLFEKYGCHAQSVPLSEALTAAGNRCSGSSGCSIVICGSLYLASWFLNNKE
ncbi:MAG: bifunctional folylpolyglutamate synthase/dihydrofolate synthase, partial [Oscillospiraceae bacterium]|nr:bifunctional folylpolyglutamate synthase/dihydrofolate synthase [Oscillospiraceae bacterium]